MNTLEGNQPENVSDDFIEAAMRAAENGAMSVSVPEAGAEPGVEQTASEESVEMTIENMSVADNTEAGAEVDSEPEGTDGVLSGEDLYEEVGVLAKYLSGVCSKIRTAEDFMSDASSDLPMGTNELAKVAKKQEEATQGILDDTDKIIENDEKLEGLLTSLRSKLFSEELSARNEIKEEVMALCGLVENNKNIMFSLMAKLSFQDSTGQQIQKVADMMNILQSRLLKMVVTFGKKSERKQAKKVSVDRGDQLLEKLNNEERMEQGLVDSVLAEFGF